MKSFHDVCINCIHFVDKIEKKKIRTRKKNERYDFNMCTVQMYGSDLMSMMNLIKDLLQNFKCRSSQMTDTSVIADQHSNFLI